MDRKLGEVYSENIRLVLIKSCKFRFIILAMYIESKSIFVLIIRCLSYCSPVLYCRHASFLKIDLFMVVTGKKKETDKEREKEKTNKGINEEKGKKKERNKEVNEKVGRIKEIKERGKKGGQKENVEY